MTVPLEWVLVHPERPFTLNAERTWHPKKRARIVKEWREAFCALALVHQLPELPALEVIAVPLLADRRLQDVGACFPAAKAAIDGLVDAGVIPKDTPEYVLSLKFCAPVVTPGSSGLQLTVIGRA